ncbi:MAG: photosystem I reaction center subunit PsaK [Microcystaceae cyanobacterium]|jgi:photosystem I subunit 10|nr:photosystem I reaction center subunit PsaK [Merismopediaceae bacterium]
MNLLMLTLAQLTPTTPSWSLSVGIIMSFCNLLAVVIGYFAIQKTGQGQGLPVPQLASKKTFGLPELLATMSFGHILGAGLVLGLASTGTL